ncbi:hypothetical protein GCM10009560_04240 [Nonomuraea longicatena]|uniref:Uncharacterized protein n=1 Tax=Nonomuraea longicatena TaxID=83682 RepID=A0ABP3Z569_9ACTN
MRRVGIELITRGAPGVARILPTSPGRGRTPGGLVADAPGAGFAAPDVVSPGIDSMGVVQAARAASADIVTTAPTARLPQAMANHHASSASATDGVGRCRRELPCFPGARVPKVAL